MKIRVTTLVIAMLCAILNTHAQSGKQNYSVKGTIIDSLTEKPVPYFTVILKNSGNSALIKSSLTDEKGFFSLGNLKAGKYIVSMAFTGYSTKSLPLNIADSLASDINLGSIRVSQQITQLKTVAIAGEKPLVKQEIDRIAYDVQSDPESKTNNALEMMRKVPYLTLDGDDNIQLKGNGAYKIMINGKPSAMLERNAKDILKSMPASSIKSIEVITDPPAKYDSEGVAGIINIITNKKIDNGYNANVNLRGTVPGAGPALNTSLNAKSGKLGLTVYGGGYINNVLPAINSSKRITNLANPVMLVQEGRRASDNQVWDGSSELSYELDSLNLIAIQFVVDGYISEGDNIATSLMSDAGGVIQGYNLLSHNRTPSNSIDLALNYQLGFKSNKNRMFTFSYRYSGSSLDQFTDVTVSNKVNYLLPNYRQTNEGYSSNKTFQLDYVQPLKKLNIEAGIKGIIRNNKSDFQYSSLTSGGSYVFDPARSNKFDNDQNVFSAYNSYQYAYKEWGFRAGVRLEQTVVNADFISSSSAVDQNYFNLIPSLLINRKFKNQSSVSLGFTQRIERPSISTLNPFVDRQNPSYETSGNPGLRPALYNNVNLTYGKFKKASLSVTVSYSFTGNVIQRLSVFNPLTNITTSNYANAGRNRRAAVSTYISYPFTKKLTTSLNAGLMYSWFQTTIDGNIDINDGVASYSGFNCGYRFDNGWRVNSSVSLSTGSVMIQGKSTGYFSSYLSINRDIVKDKLTFSASAYNPFTHYRKINTDTNGDNFIQTGGSKINFRTFSGGLNYRFGRLKESIKKNKRGINNDDVAGG